MRSLEHDLCACDWAEHCFATDMLACEKGSAALSRSRTCCVPRNVTHAWQEVEQTFIGERLYVNMTEEGPSGEYIMTMQRDRQGRWMPTKGERTTNIQKVREERRSFYVGESKEHRPFSIASAEASSLHGEVCLSRRNAVFESNRNRMAMGARFQGCDDHRSHASGCDLRKTM